MEHAKLSIRRSQERSFDAARLARRQTRRTILDSYMGGEEAAKSPPRKSLPSHGQDGASPDHTKKVPEIWVDTKTREHHAKTWSPDRKDVYSSLPSFSQNMPGSLSPKTSVDGPGAAGGGVPPTSGGVLSNTTSTSIGGGEGEGDDIISPNPASPTRGVGGGGGSPKQAPISLGSLFAFGNPKPSPHSASDTELESGQRPVLFKSTSDFLSATEGRGGALFFHDDSIVLRRSVATGIALGATAGVVMGINSSHRGSGGGMSLGKAAVAGGVVGAGVGYGLSNPFKTA